MSVIAEVNKLDNNINQVENLVRSTFFTTVFIYDEPLKIYRFHPEIITYYFELFQQVDFAICYVFGHEEEFV